MTEKQNIFKFKKEEIERWEYIDLALDDRRDTKTFSFVVEFASGLIEAAEEIRTKCGFGDDLITNPESVLYYDFFLSVDEEKKSVEIDFIVNESLYDDGDVYSIPLAENTKKDLFLVAVEKKNLELGISNSNIKNKLEQSVKKENYGQDNHDVKIKSEAR